jgi:hypothetical protein
MNHFGLLGNQKHHKKFFLRLQTFQEKAGDLRSQGTTHIVQRGKSNNGSWRAEQAEALIDTTIHRYQGGNFKSGEFIESIQSYNQLGARKPPFTRPLDQVIESINSSSTGEKLLETRGNLE